MCAYNYYMHMYAYTHLSCVNLIYQDGSFTCRCIHTHLFLKKFPCCKLYLVTLKKDTCLLDKPKNVIKHYKENNHKKPQINKEHNKTTKTYYDSVLCIFVLYFWLRSYVTTCNRAWHGHFMRFFLYARHAGVGVGG